MLPILRPPVHMESEAGSTNLFLQLSLIRTYKFQVDPPISKQHEYREQKSVSGHVTSRTPFCVQTLYTLYWGLSSKSWADTFPFLSDGDGPLKIHRSLVLLIVHVACRRSGR